MSSAFVGLFTNSTPLGSCSNVDSKSFGALISAIPHPSLIPSFFAKGVPEYPAMLGHQSLRTFHHVKPIKLQTVIVIKEVINPKVHQVR